MLRSTNLLKTIIARKHASILWATQTRFDSQLKEVKVPNTPNAIGPYSKAIIHNKLVYTSGQIPVDSKTGEIVGTTIGEQTHVALQNLKQVLECSGSSMSKVIKTTVYLNSIEEWPEMNRVYQEYFSEPYPARSAFEVGKLPKDSKLEIECIAAI
ncbi:hypothetical protein BB559_006253 [Furculomyces boomerangus]|uniref:Uncharacterized protein n=1 Tax=Furculomyces boomerangus TaxID=61424 RepID=A0A2T9Y469_9FUNG|nr:hypothetical protein BB559_006253 [Furculomyces boomerangus]